MSKTLTKEFATCQVDYDGALYSLQNDVSSGWRQITPGQPQFIADTYFDLAGMTIEDQTLFFEGATIQEILNPQFAPSTAGDGGFVIDIMSQIPLTDTEVASFGSVGNIAQGFGSALTFHQTIYGRVRYFNIDEDNQASGYAILLSDNQLGSLSPTASDRVYCYRFVAMSMNAPGVFSVFGARYILRANAKEEPEYEYLMRLKRSYELQNEPDRD